MYVIPPARRVRARDRRHKRRQAIPLGDGSVLGTLRVFRRLAPCSLNARLKSVARGLPEAAALVLGARENAPGIVVLRRQSPSAPSKALYDSGCFRCLAERLVVCGSYACVDLRTAGRGSATTRPERGSSTPIPHVRSTAVSSGVHALVECRNSSPYNKTGPRRMGPTISARRHARTHTRAIT